jgi:hypothetical protein
MNITRITIGRLYNLGSYEHIRYELSVEIPQGESAATVMMGMENVLSALNPKTHTHARDELEREKRSIEEMRRILAVDGPDDFRRIFGRFEGTPEEYIARCEEIHVKNVAERDAWEARCRKARMLLDDFGGAANWKDAKQDWDVEDFD